MLFVHVVQIHVLCFLQLKKREGDCLHKNSSEESFNLCQKSTESSESDGAERLEATYPHHKKHVRTTKRAHMERQARTHSPWSNSLGGLGVAEERPLLN